MKDPLLSLAPAELRALATSVRKGRVSAPYSALSVQQIVGQHAAVSVSSKLDLLSSSGMSPEAVSVCLELTADALSSRSPLEDLVDLVTTGPEAGGVANRSTAVVVSELFRGAEHSVLIAGYAVYQGQRVFRSLGDRMVQCPELDVRMFLDVTGNRVIHHQQMLCSPGSFGSSRLHSGRTVCRCRTSTAVGSR